MRQEVVKAAMLSEWPTWRNRNREKIRGKENHADSLFVEDFLKLHPEYVEWSKARGKLVSAKTRMEMWADYWRKEEIAIENARMVKK